MARPKQNQTQATAPATSASPKKKLSLSEFRAWLSGVEEMQPAGWSPDGNQWKIIRSKIEEVMEMPVQQPRRFVADYGDEETTRIVRPSAPSAFPMGPGPGAPSASAPPALAAPGEKVKTPTIDTSKTPYESSFG